MQTQTPANSSGAAAKAPDENAALDAVRKTNEAQGTYFKVNRRYALTFDELIESLNKKYDFHLKKIPTGLGPSDQMSFYAKKVPVFFLFTDDHPDYHRPSDTADKINVPGMRRVVDLTEELGAHLAAVPERPEYVKVAGPSLSPGASGPRLGIMPDYGDDAEGVLLGGVSEGGPAAKAGLKEGDRIVDIAGQPVRTWKATWC